MLVLEANFVNARPGFILLNYHSSPKTQFVQVYHDLMHRHVLRAGVPEEWLLVGQGHVDKNIVQKLVRGG